MATSWLTLSMPTQRRRVALSLAPEALTACEELAEATGQPVATLIAGLLLEMAPQLRDMAKVARALKSGKKQAAKVALSHMMGNAMAELISEQMPLKGVK